MRPPGDGNAVLAPSAHFIEAHRRDRADKREAGCDDTPEIAETFDQDVPDVGGLDPAGPRAGPGCPARS